MSQFNYDLPDCRGEKGRNYLDLIATWWRHFKTQKDYMVTGVVYIGELDLWGIEHKHGDEPAVVRSLHNFFGLEAFTGVKRFAKLNDHQTGIARFNQAAEQNSKALDQLIGSRWSGSPITAHVELRGHCVPEAARSDRGGMIFTEDALKQMASLINDVPVVDRRGVPEGPVAKWPPVNSPYEKVQKPSLLLRLADVFRKDVKRRSFMSMPDFVNAASYLQYELLHFLIKQDHDEWADDFRTRLGKFTREELLGVLDGSGWIAIFKGTDWVLLTPGQDKALGMVGPLSAVAEECERRGY